ncbi:Uncharacterized protein FWK35_00018886 [Aphis craccivora]|uniref:HAT C-terminal dimerisation domain-containing protein n=1 Tax=Aphis craccivora TaxID=307492 RepID=A0A6G0W1V6_APHCR|nr:Uncharacterized protein FWK35_00018886 [Aphis craccivora]
MDYTDNSITRLVDLKKVVEAEVYPNLYKLLKVALTIPVSSATCERSFSAMKRIKIGCEIQCAKKNLQMQISNNLWVEDVLNDFAKYNHRILL